MDVGLKELIKTHFEELTKDYSNFRLTFLSNDAVVTGCFELSVQDGQESIIHECYISIYISADYPEELPVVREFGGLISCDFHTNPNGALCLGVIPDIWLCLDGQLTLSRFVKKCVAPFFYSALQKEKFGKVVQGERSHGTKGIQEFFEEYFSCKDQHLLRVLYATRYNLPKTRTVYPCGSNQTYKLCCKDKIERLLRCCPPDVKSDIDLLIKKLTFERRIIIYGFYGSVRQAMLAELPKPEIQLTYNVSRNKIKPNSKESPARY